MLLQEEIKVELKHLGMELLLQVQVQEETDGMKPQELIEKPQPMQDGLRLLGLCNLVTKLCLKLLPLQLARGDLGGMKLQELHPV